MIIKYNPKIKYLRRPSTDEIFIDTKFIRQFKDLVEWVPTEDETLSSVELGVGEHTKSELRKQRVKDGIRKIPKNKWAKKFGARPAMPKIADLRKYVGDDLTLEEVIEVINNDSTSVEAEGTQPA